MSNSKAAHKPIVYIDGQAGTTGLEIAERLRQRNDIELLSIADHLRHDDAARKQAMSQADLVILCLPDAAAIEAEKLCPKETRLIDTSTAYRTRWTYGFADLKAGQKEAIASSLRVANPGCHATGAIALIAPLAASGLLPADASIPIVSLTGYTGGGKKMIAEYESSAAPEKLAAPGAYGRTLSHKHIPEIMKLCGLSRKPLFLPVVDDYPRGMMTSILLDLDQFAAGTDPEQIKELYKDWYASSLTVHIDEKDGMLYAGELAGFDDLSIAVSGNDHQVLLQACFDNLGKGACGAAIHNMNLMLGLQEDAGLRLSAKKENLNQGKENA